jgi:hypothetical protein
MLPQPAKVRRYACAGIRIQTEFNEEGAEALSCPSWCHGNFRIVWRCGKIEGIGRIYSDGSAYDYNH